MLSDSCGLGGECSVLVNASHNGVFVMGWRTHPVPQPRLLLCDDAAAPWEPWGEHPRCRTAISVPKGAAQAPLNALYSLKIRVSPL